MRIVQRKAWGPWILTAILVAILSELIITAIRVRIIDTSVFTRYVFSREVLIAAANTISLGTLALFMGVVLGLAIALMNISGSILLSSLASTYIYIFRGTPLLLQIIFWFNAFPTMFPTFRVTIPFLGKVLYQAKMTDVVTPYIAALIALGLAEAAYMAEIMRAGILAVDTGQRDAARSLGLLPSGVLRRIVIPQASRIIIPAAGNQYISLLKSTSLASVIGYMELVRVSTDIYSANFHVVELLAVAAFWYLLMAASATMLQYALERAFPQR